jgi:Ca2+-transporting ATPase
VTLLDIDSVKGLSSREAADKLTAEGYNELPESKKRGFFWIVFEVIHEPMFLLLVASGLLYFMLGDFSEGVMLMSFVVVIIGITVYQEDRTGIGSPQESFQSPCAGNPGRRTKTDTGTRSCHG